MWAISIGLISLGFILGVFFLQRFISEEKKDINKIIHLDHKDFFYIILIISILFILWVSADLSYREDVVDFVGFAGTVTSIILGVIAIIYSMIQSASAANSQKALDDSALELTSIVDELKEQINKSKSVSECILDNYNNVVNTIEGLEGKLDESIERLDRVEKQIKKDIIVPHNSINLIHEDDFEWE